ncbi:hypothetical protein C8Q77DRAFT_594453 [Trametes polyzona]|nr:hypothetical protein C8Q77DRAFT_594453 [Trametes polyzona]
MNPWLNTCYGPAETFRQLGNTASLSHQTTRPLSHTYGPPQRTTWRMYVVFLGAMVNFCRATGLLVGGGGVHEINKAYSQNLCQCGTAVCGRPIAADWKEIPRAVLLEGIGQVARPKPRYFLARIAFSRQHAAYYWTGTSYELPLYHHAKTMKGELLLSPGAGVQDSKRHICEEDELIRIIGRCGSRCSSARIPPLTPPDSGTSVSKSPSPFTVVSSIRDILNINRWKKLMRRG